MERKHIVPAVDSDGDAAETYDVGLLVELQVVEMSLFVACARLVGPPWGWCIFRGQEGMILG